MLSNNIKSYAKSYIKVKSINECCQNAKLYMKLYRKKHISLSFDKLKEKYYC